MAKTIRRVGFLAGLFACGMGCQNPQKAQEPLAFNPAARDAIIGLPNPQLNNTSSVANQSIQNRFNRPTPLPLGSDTPQYATKPFSNLPPETEHPGLGANNANPVMQAGAIAPIGQVNPLENGPLPPPDMPIAITPTPGIVPAEPIAPAAISPPVMPTTINPTTIPEPLVNPFPPEQPPAIVQPPMPGIVPPAMPSMPPIAPPVQPIEAPLPLMPESAPLPVPAPSSPGTLPTLPSASESLPPLPPG